VADLAKNGQTTDPILAAILTAKAINQFCGTHIAPWEMERVPDEFAQACLSLTNQLPKYMEHEQKVRESDEAFKNERRRRR
jgi:hypothetical protein